MLLAVPFSWAIHASFHHPNAGTKKCQQYLRRESKHISCVAKACFLSCQMYPMVM